MTLTMPSKKEAGSDTFHVFFQAGKMEDFKRAFQEFASEKQGELTKPPCGDHPTADQRYGKTGFS